MLGVTIQGSYYPLPTLQISSETRSNLAELKLTILSLMSVCSGVPRDDIWVKIRFIMTDSVSHNLGVEELVSERLGLEHVPRHLVCQVHPSLMFNRETTGLFKDIDTKIGHDKIFAAFAIGGFSSQFLVKNDHMSTRKWLF